MKLADPVKESRLLDYPWNGCVAPNDGLKRWRAKDAQIRLHNLARQVARMANKAARNQYCDEMSKARTPEFMVRFRGLVAHYWRRLKRLQQRSGK